MADQTVHPTKESLARQFAALTHGPMREMCVKIADDLKSRREAEERLVEEMLRRQQSQPR